MHDPTATNPKILIKKGMAKQHTPEWFQNRISELENVIKQKEIAIEKARLNGLSVNDKTKLSFFDNMSNNIAVWASRGKNDNYEITFWSKGAEQVYGRSEIDALGKNCIDLFMTEEFKEDAREDCDNIIQNDDKFKNMIATDMNANGHRITVITNTFRISDYERPNQYLQGEIGVDISSISETLKDYRSVEEVDNKLSAMENLVEAVHSIDEMATTQCTLEDFLNNIIISTNKLFGEDVITLISFTHSQFNIILPNNLEIKATEESIKKLIQRSNIDVPNFRPKNVKPSLTIPFFQHNTKTRIGFMYIEFPENYKWNEVEQWTLEKFSHQIHFAIKYKVLTSGKLNEI